MYSAKFMMLLVGVLALISFSAYGEKSAVPLTAKKLTLVFDNELPQKDSYNIKNLISEFQNRIGTALGVASTSVFINSTPKTLGNGKIYFTLQIKDSSIQIIDSVATHEAYTKYASKWANALRAGGDLTKPFQLNKQIKLNVDPELFEMDEGISSDTGGAVEKEDDDPSTSDTKLQNDLSTAMNTRYDVLQLRLGSTSYKAFQTSYKAFGKIIDGIYKAAGLLLKVPDDRVVLYNVKSDGPNGIIVQFTIYPANLKQLVTYSQQWDTSVRAKDKTLLSIFNDIDFSYPALYKTGFATTTTTHVPTTTVTGGGGVNGGLVAGCVVGGLAAVGIVGGGSYYAKRYFDKNNAQKKDHFTERSPESNVEVRPSPSGLHNINIEGEVTPNPHNFR